MSKRASIFEDVPEVDLTAFAPKKNPDRKAPSKEQVRAVAEASNFPSREGIRPVPDNSGKRTSRVHRTGRNVQFNIKASLETTKAFYDITDAHPGWVLGYTLERAVAALQRELETET